MFVDVWHFEKNLQNKESNFLGEVAIPVSSIKDDNTIADAWFPLCPNAQQTENDSIRGEVRLMIKYKYEDVKYDYDNGSFVLNNINKKALSQGQKTTNNKKILIGAPLSSTYTSADRPLPDFLIHIFAYFLSDVEKMKHKGLFRIPSKTDVMNESRDRLNRGETIHWETEFSDDPDLVGSIFKLYLRELPEPLFPFHFYRQMVTIFEGDSQEESKEEISVEKILKVLKELPSYNYQFLCYFFHFMNRIAYYCEYNCMSENNLAIVFGPSLIRTQTENFASMMDLPTINQVTYFMIMQTPILFPNVLLDSLIPLSKKIFEEPNSPRNNYIFSYIFK